MFKIKQMSHIQCFMVDGHFGFRKKKFRIRETKNLSTDADSRTDTILERLHDLSRKKNKKKKRRRKKEKQIVEPPDTVEFMSFSSPQLPAGQASYRSMMSSRPVLSQHRGGRSKGKRKRVPNLNDLSDKNGPLDAGVWQRKVWFWQMVGS